MTLTRKEMVMENLLPIIRAALALVGAAVALALLLGRRRRRDMPTINLRLLSPAASVAHSRPGTAPRAN